jgi:type VI secretion system protein ImpA
MITSLRTAPLVESRAMGRFGLRDILASTGEMAPPPGQPAPDPAHIDAAFLDCELEALQKNADAVTEAIGLVQATEATLTERVGAAQSASLDPLVKALVQVDGILRDRLTRRGVVPLSDGGGAPAAAGAPGQVAAAAAPPPAAGEIRSREDAIRMMEKISDYFVSHEPSSPVPILLKRAQALVSRNFMEILQDLAPDGLKQFKSIAGKDNSE